MILFLTENFPICSFSKNKHLVPHELTITKILKKLTKVKAIEKEKNESHK